HEHRVRQHLAGEGLVEPQRVALADVEPLRIAVEADDQARRRVVARGNAGIGAGERLENPPAPLDHRMAPRIDMDAPVEPRGRAVRARLKHRVRVALDEAILAARSEGRNDERAPAAGRRLAGAAGGDRKSTRLNSSHVEISYA